MDELEKDFPAICTVYVIGKSVEGRDIKVTDILHSKYTIIQFNFYHFFAIKKATFNSTVLVKARFRSRFITFLKPKIYNVDIQPLYQFFGSINNCKWAMTSICSE